MVGPLACTQTPQTSCRVVIHSWSLEFGVHQSCKRCGEQCAPYSHSNFCMRAGKKHGLADVNLYEGYKETKWSHAWEDKRMPSRQNSSQPTFSSTSRDDPQWPEWSKDSTSEKADTFKVSRDAPHLVCLRGNCRETRVRVNGAHRRNRGDARSDEYRGLGPAGPACGIAVMHRAREHHCDAPYA
jgi:hypothetical protein